MASSPSFNAFPVVMGAAAVVVLSRLVVRKLSEKPTEAAAVATKDEAAKAREKRVSNSIRGIPDFPKKGIMFWDITTLMLQPAVFQECIDMFVERYRAMNVDVIVGAPGFEARGFLFGPPIALALQLPFVPLRKPKKLPGPTIGVEYTLEYGTDRLEMHVGAISAGQRVVLIDDLIATGGTLIAGIKLMEMVRAHVLEAACVVELPDLHGRKKLEQYKVPLFTLIDKEGD